MKVLLVKTVVLLSCMQYNMTELDAPFMFALCFNILRSWIDVIGRIQCRRTRRTRTKKDEHALQPVFTSPLFFGWCIRDMSLWHDMDYVMSRGSSFVILESWDRIWFDSLFIRFFLLMNRLQNGDWSDLLKSAETLPTTVLRQLCTPMMTHHGIFNC